MRSRFLQSLMIANLVLVGCSSAPDKPKTSEPYQVQTSYLKETAAPPPENKVDNRAGLQNQQQGFEKLQSVGADSSGTGEDKALEKQFSEQAKVTFAANSMPMTEFVHYAFGEVLGVNYVIGPKLKQSAESLTLNVQQEISKRELYSLLINLLARQQVSVDFNENLFFIEQSELSKAKAVIGIGKTPGSVPSVSGQILQIIPIKYGIKLSVERTVRDLIDASVTVDIEQSALFVLGDRANVLRAIELVNLVDVPANRGNHIALMSLTYIPSEEFIAKTTELMNSEGLPVGNSQDRGKNILLVPIEHIGAVAVFASSEDLLDRVRYWASIMDKPPQGESQQYFVYNPRYARASDIGESLNGLLSLGRPAAQTNDRSTGANADALAQQETSGAQVVSGDEVSFVVDERSNSIIFSTTGGRYQRLLPLMEKLDVLPRQVLLEVIIAEVTLSGNFQYGVEFALRNSSQLSLSTLGAFNAGSTGGLNVGFVDGDNQLIASFFQDNSFVNLLSNPSLLVRDGVSATISVGTDIPILGATVTDPINGERQTQEIEYRQTGVDVRVTPTINAQGVVIMEIEKNISNQVDASAGAIASPTIFERALSTEVVVESGRTVILGGLISEDSSNAESKVPVLGDLPLVGNLFRGRNQQKSKTELVMLVTPRVVDRNDQWEKLMVDFQNGLENIKLPQ